MLIYTVLVPLVIYPILFVCCNDFALWVAGRFERQTARVAVAPNTDARGAVIQKVKAIKQLVVFESPNPLIDLQQGKADIAVTFQPPAKISISIATSDLLNQSAITLLAAVTAARNAEIKQLAEKSGISEEGLKVFRVNYVDVAASSKTNEVVPVDQLQGIPIGVLVLATLVWVHIAIATGPPATIMFAEEKEKHTFETTLSAPVLRSSVVLGKFIATYGVALFAGLMYTSGIVLTAVALFGGLVEKVKVKSTSMSIEPWLGFLKASPESYIYLTLGILMAAALCSALYLVATVRATNFKEAQVIVTLPMLYCAFAPGFAFVPGIELTPATAFIPLTNLFLVIKRGEPDLILALISFGVVALATAICLLLTIKTFATEPSLRKS